MLTATRKIVSLKKALVTITSACAISLSSGVSADNHGGPEFKASPITPSLTLLQGKGGNIVLSKGSDGLLIIDDDYADMADKLKAQIEAHGGMSSLKYILNTHWHGDHSGGNAALGKGVDIVAHDNVRARLSSKQEIAFFKMVSDPQPKHALPNLTYPQTMTIHFNDDAITLTHYANGHTDGDSVVRFEKANVIHMGDHMFYPMFPFVDLGSGGNAVNYSKNVMAILKTVDDKTVVTPGHGPLTDKQGLASYSAMLNGTIAEVTAMKDQGLSLEQAQAKGLSDQWDSWGGGFIKEPVWISFIYGSL